MFNKKENTKVIQYPLYFTIRKTPASRKGTYDVFDEDGKRVFKIKKDGILNRVSVFDSTGTRMFSVKEKNCALKIKYVFYINKKEIGHIKFSMNLLKPYTLFYKDWAIDKHALIKGSTRLLKNKVPCAFIEMVNFQKEYIVNYIDPNHALDCLMIFTGITYSDFFYNSTSISNR